MDFQPLTRRPAFRTAAGLGVTVVGYFLLRRGLPAPGLPSLLLDLGLFAIVLAFTLALASQFVLPVRRISERLAAVRRLFGYGLGERGPVLFIEDGRPIESSRDRRGGPGVLLIGQASAAVLRTDVSYTRAVGPGVVFTPSGERLAEALDLRRQVRRQRGRPTPATTASGALTRDGIPISADLSVTFMLDPGHSFRPREGSHPALPPFEFHPQSAIRAVYGHAYGEAQDVPWTELPLRLAADVWRERAKSRPLSAFLGADIDARHTLADLRQEILARLQGPGEDAGSAHAAGESPAREAELLRARGIRVLDVHVGSVYLPEEVRRERIQQWKARWTAAHESELTEVRALEGSLRRQAIQESAQTLRDRLTGELRAALSAGATPGPLESLRLIARDAVRLAGDADRSPEAGPLADHLRSMAEEIENLMRDDPRPGTAA
jgi:regulator of protease activity HflC (stomatin/prohibitin superfamily)